MQIAPLPPRPRHRARPFVTRYAFRKGPVLRGAVLPMDAVRVPPRRAPVRLAAASLLVGLTAGAIVLLSGAF